MNKKTKSPYDKKTKTKTKVESKKVDSKQAQVLIKSNAAYQELFYITSDDEQENCELIPKKDKSELSTFGVTVKKRDNGSNYEDQSFLILEPEKDFYINDVFSGGQEIIDIEQKVNDDFTPQTSVKFHNFSLIETVKNQSI